MPDKRTRTAVLRTSEELRHWLDNNTWFEDGEVLEVYPQPAHTKGLPATIRLVVTEAVSGNYVAETQRTMHDFALTARGVRSCTLDHVDFVEGNCFECLEVLDAESGVAFALHVPGRLEIHCSELEIGAVAVRTETVPPWLSESEIAATVADMTVPACETWVRWFQEQGVTVCWRIYGERSAGIPNVFDYEGWFLAQPERLSTEDGGLFFFACNDHRGHLSLQLRCANGGDIVWEAARRILATFSSARIQCGNCELSALEWRTYLATGNLPERLNGC